MAEDAIRVLMVDESADDAVLLDLALRRDGLVPDILRVGTAEALTVALHEEIGWDVVLCDAIMPRLDAARAVAMVHDALPTVPILLVTGRYPCELWHELGSGIVTAFINKARLLDQPALITGMMEKRVSGGRQRTGQESERPGLVRV
jgi:CheY-like chemotaxis protein